MNVKRIATMAAALFISLTVGVSVSLAEDKAPITMRAVGGANMGGTWNVGLAGIGKLVNDRYPGSTFNVLQGASTSNPLRLESNQGDITCTQSFNTYAALNGLAPYKKKLENLTAIANINDVSRFQIICSKKLDVKSFDEIIEKKLPIKLDRGNPGQLHHQIGKMLLAEYGLTYADIEKWGGKVSAASNNDLVGLMQDGTVNIVFKLGPGEQSQIQEMVLNANVKWLPVAEDKLKAVAQKTGIGIGFVPASFYNGAVGQDIPCLTDTSILLLRKGVSESDAYKVTKSIVEGHEELGIILPTWKTIKPETMTKGMLVPLHPGAEKYYREAGLIK